MSERVLPYVFVRDDNVPDVQRVTFIRLVEANTRVPVDTLTANEAHVDIDADGNVIGVTLFMDPT